MSTVSAPDLAPAAQPTVIRPVWIPMPRQSKQRGVASPRCPHSGLTRAQLHFLCVPSTENKWKPAVVSRKMSRKGSKRGIRLVNYESLMTYIAGLPVDSVPDGAEEGAD